MIHRLDTGSADFEQSLAALTAFSEEVDSTVVARVEEIIASVRQRGDGALLEYTALFDDLQVESVADLELGDEQLQEALARIPEPQRVALQAAAARIETYHQHQRADSWDFRDDSGNRLGQQVTPLDRVGVYVPGGKASYPSSVLMNVIPARVAGVPEIVMVVPAPGGELSDLVLAAAAVAGVTRVFKLGGAQAVAALAYGTDSVPQVDKIVGPGNIYVATAKRMVFGQVDIDMIAGPSEVLVICDGLTDPEWIAMDMFAQAEHDENAQALLLSPDADFLARVEQVMQDLLPQMDRSAIIATSLAERGALIKTRDIAEAVEVSNRVAPEHLELSVENPETLLPDVRHAGAIFLGRHSAEALGDYCAGPNHVLPTSGSARFFSPLGVYDFQKRSSVIYCSEQGLAEMAPLASTLARGESLQAHARSVEMRLQRREGSSEDL